MGAGVFYRIFCIVLGTLALGRLAFAQTTSVEVPCKAANTPPTACKLFSSPCATTIQSVIEDLDKSIQNKLDGFARGKDLSLFEMDSNGQPLESPTSPACELAAIPPEITQNRFGVQCGTQARITMNGPDLTNDPGGNSYKIGVKSTAIRCFWNTVKAELQAQGKINNIPTSCQGLADDVNAVIAQSNSAWNQLLAREGGPAGTNNLCSAKMIRDFQNEVPEACRDDRAPASEEEVAQVVNQRQGACFLAAARGALYTAVLPCRRTCRLRASSRRTPRALRRRRHATTAGTLGLRTRRAR